METIYQIEVDLAELRDIRLFEAGNLVEAVKNVGAARKAKKSDREIDRLWEVVSERERRYSLSCRAIDALERHHLDSHVLAQLGEFIADAEKERREGRREGYDHRGQIGDYERAILTELRAIRDRFDPPRASRADEINARKELKKLHSDGND